MFLKNKHLIIAALVAPVLALISYFAIDAFVGESPHVAEEGQSYPLAEMSNCRYNSGSCSLKNVDFELVLSPEWRDDGRLLLTLTSALPLDGVVLALAGETGEEPPREMRRMDDEGLVWSLEMARPDAERNRLHIVASSSQSLWFGDAALKFILPKTEP